MIAKNGKINGRGKMYRWVSGLTANERAAVRAGKTVLIEDGNPHYLCTPYKVVTYHNGRYAFRNYYGNGVPA